MKAKYKETGFTHTPNFLIRTQDDDSDFPSSDNSPPPAIPPEMLADSLSQLHGAVLAENPRALLLSLQAVTSFISLGFVTDDCWSILSDSPLIADLLHCVDADADLEVADHALLCARQLFDQSRSSLESFIAGGGLLAVLGRIHISTPVPTLRHCLAIVRILARHEMAELLTGDPAWLTDLLAIVLSCGDRAFLPELAAFLPTAVWLFPAQVPLFFGLAAALLERSLRSRDAPWPDIQAAALATFADGLAAAFQPLDLLALETPRLLIGAFAALAPANQIIALKVIRGFFAIPQAPERLLAIVVRPPFPLGVFLDALAAENEKLMRGVLSALDAFFRVSPDLVAQAVENGLPGILMQLIESGGFAVKVRVLRLIETVCVWGSADEQRRPFAAGGFLELLVDALDEQAAPELHNAALTTLFALRRTCEGHAEICEVFDEIIAAEALREK